MFYQTAPAVKIGDALNRLLVAIVDYQKIETAHRQPRFLYERQERRPSWMSSGVRLHGFAAGFSDEQA